MLKKNFIIVITIIVVSISAVLYKLDYKISQADKHPDWPEFKKEGKIDSIGCTTKGNLIIEDIEKYHINSDSLIKSISFDSSRVKAYYNLIEQGEIPTPLWKNNPNLVITDSITYVNEFSWGTTFNGFGLSGTGGTTSGKHYDEPIVFLHKQKFYLKLKFGNNEGEFKFTKNYSKYSLWFYQLNYPFKDNDIMYVTDGGSIFLVYNPLKIKYLNP